jgi:2-C-methyl-D-erythritol 2,4-cyclodiphosphate synthase
LFKVGFGYDSHRFEEKRKLILGGVEITDQFGLAGHSDADVLLHALIDALLGSLGEGDIGTHFPDDDPEYKGISSLKLLEEVVEKTKEKQYIINNCDLVIVSEIPKLEPFRQEIVNSISNVLKIEKEKINFKATTNEKMGFVGRKEGMAAYAVVSLVEEKLLEFFNWLDREGSNYDVSERYNDSRSNNN